MLKDTSALIKIRGIYVPERGSAKHKAKDLEMEIVTSHDPNKMSIADTRVNYRFYKMKDLDFKIRFQNNGEGPATSIKLIVDVPAVYDRHSLKLKDSYPNCPVCPKEEVTHSCIDTTFVDGKIIFHFKNIYLPGSHQKSVNDYDSTKGFVKYSLRFKNKIQKQNARSRTAIIFDKNEPIFTNYTATRFNPGISVGVKGGYNFYPGITSDSYFGGVTISPYKALHGYLQAELMAGNYHTTDSARFQEITPLDGAIGLSNLYDVKQRTSTNQVLLYVVPVSYVYSLNNIVGISAGVQLRTVIFGEVATQGVKEYYIYSSQQGFRERDRRRDVNISNRTHAKEFSGFDAGIFGGITLGMARIGPTLGARYVYYLDNPNKQLQLYLLWKF